MFLKNETNKSLAKRIFLEDLGDCIYFPKYFEIETVNICNAHCIICPIDDWSRRRKAIMSTDLFSKFQREVSQYSDWIETICLARDGEPTLDPHLAGRIQMLKESGIKKVTISTNGQLLTVKLTEALINAGLDDIMVSIDGITKGTFEQIRLGLDYETVLNNTLGLIQKRNKINSKMTIRLRMAVIEKNKHEVDDWLKYWSSWVRPQDKVYAMPAHSWGSQLRKINFPAVNTDLSQVYFDKPCVFPFSSVAMHVDGKIGLCNVDYNLKYLMGDFSKHSLKEIWTSEKFSKVRWLHANNRRNEINFCRGCNLWDREYEFGK